jgi:hypothetical protein
VEEERRGSEDQGGERHENKQDHGDPTHLTYLNPSKEGISQSNQTGISKLSMKDSNAESETGSVSPFPPSKSVRSCKVDLDNLEDFLDFEDFSSPERISPLPPTEY